MSNVYENPNDGELVFESTTTLVEPHPRTTLLFDRSSVVNATIYSCDRPVYEIKSNGSLSRTELFDLNEQKMVASIRRRQFFSNVVVFAHRGHKSIKIDEWLKHRKIPDGQTCVDRLHTLAGTFVWKSEALGAHRFTLYVEGQDDSPIAYSRSTYRPPTIGLILKPGWDHVLVEIITSFLVLENKFRNDNDNKDGSEMVYAALAGLSLMH